MPRKINLSVLKKNYTPPVEEIQEELIQVDKNKLEENIRESVELLLKTNNKILNFTIKEAAHTLGISQEFLRRRMVAGKIKTINFGDKKMITIFEIARLLVTGVK